MHKQKIKLFQRAIEQVTCAALLASLIGCNGGSGTPDTETETSTSTGDGDGDGDPTGDGDGDGDGDPATEGDCTPGEFGCACDNGMCDDTLVCENDQCGFPSGDGDGDGDGDLGDCNPDDSYCPAVNGCMEAGGQALILDLDQNGEPDWAWCLHDCFNDGSGGDGDGDGDGDGTTGDGDGDGDGGTDTGGTDTGGTDTGGTDTGGTDTGGTDTGTTGDGDGDTTGDGDGDMPGPDDSLCPAHPADGGQAVCVDWSQMGDYGCFLPCSPNDPDSCAPGSMCLAVGGGTNLCVYLPTGF